MGFCYANQILNLTAVRARRTLDIEEGYISAFDVHQNQHALAM